jgi:3-deoxy-D-manno-octulosonic-acid transferase
MQSEVDCQRVKSLGANPEKVFSVGNLKYDIHCDFPLPEDLAKYLSSAQPLWIAASTMPQEEAIVLDAFRQAKEKTPGLRLLIAPRHPERFNEVLWLIEKSGFSSTRRSHLKEDADIILLDSLGELAATFGFARVVFVGGSLVAHGGHNILEPAFFEKPILFGPHMENFREIASRFLQEEAAMTVQSAFELAEKITAILSDDRLAKKMGAHAKKIVDENRGATQRTVHLIQEEIAKGKHH